MFKTFKKYFFAWRFKRAVRTANERARIYGMKFYVIYINRSIKVVPKQAIKELIKCKRFRKGVTIDDIEKNALYITT